jgi:tRNA(Ile)-lysidine synthase
MEINLLKQALIAALPAETASILVAVSGGVDSVVLLHLLTRIAPELGLEIQAAHLDHGIRAASGRDADFVSQLCRQWGCPCHTEQRDVPALAKEQKISLEMAGREVRREFLEQLAAGQQADLVALAHHRDDQVETFMLRLIRGSGQSGLGGMHIQAGLWWRPLLTCSRAQILEYAQQNQLAWVEDETNRDPTYLRNRIRNQLVPQLLTINPRFGERIAETTRQIQLEEDYWQEQVATGFQHLAAVSEEGVSLSRSGLLQLHPALRMRLYREALRRVRGDLLKVEAVHLRAIDELVVGVPPQVQIDLPSAWVARRYQRLWFCCCAPAEPQPFCLELPLPGRLELPDGRLLEATIVGRGQGESATTAEFSLPEIDAPLLVRSWCAGDRFAPLGMDGHKRLKRFFAERRLSFEERARTPLLVAADTILWVIGQRRSRHAQVTPEDRRILRLCLRNRGRKTL